MTGSELSQTKDSRKPLSYRLRLAMRVHGPLDGILITVYRAMYRRRWMRLGYRVQAVSDRLASFWFRRLLRKYLFADAEGSASPAAVPEEET